MSPLPCSVAHASRIFQFGICLCYAGILKRIVIPILVWRKPLT